MKFLCTKNCCPCCLIFDCFNFFRLVFTCFKCLVLQNLFLKKCVCPDNFNYYTTDQVYFNLEFSHGNKTTPSLSSNFCICIFKKIPCTTKDLDELFDYKIFPLLSFYNWKKLELLNSKHQQNIFSRLKNYIKLAYPKNTFLPWHF